MNNLRLLTGALWLLLAGAVACCFAQERVIGLEEIFLTAESNSAQLRPSRTSVKEADKEVSIARSNRLPDISGQLSFSYLGDGFTTKRNLTDCEKAPIPHFGNGLSVKVEQPIYTGGAITNSIRLAELKSIAARFAEEFKRDDVRFRLAGYYLDIYRYRNLRSVIEANLSAANKVLRDMKSRYEQGIVLRNDITRYELLVSNLELEITRIDNTVEILNNNLIVSFGLPEGTVVIPDSTILERSLSFVSEEWWLSEAEVNSPGIALARIGVDISCRAESIVKSEKLPKIGIEALWTIDGPILVEVPPINRNLSYVILSGYGVSNNFDSLPYIYCPKRSSIYGLPTGIDYKRVYRSCYGCYARPGFDRGMA